MKKKNSVFLDIDFHDATYRSCEMSKNNLSVYLNSWDDKLLKITFLNAIQFSYKLGDVVEGVFKQTGESPFLDEALSLLYEEIPPKHPFKLFQIVDIYEFPFFEVVAEKGNVQIVPKTC